MSSADKDIFRRLIFGCVSMVSLPVAVFELITTVAGPRLLDHSSVAQGIATVALLVFGFIIGWGCGR